MKNVLELFYKGFDPRINYDKPLVIASKLEVFLEILDIFIKLEKI